MSLKKDRRVRDSIFVAETKLQSIINEHLLHLRKIWDEVGMDEQQRGDRIETVITHVDSLFCEMTAEEKQMANDLYETIQEYKAKILDLCKQLHEVPYEIPKERSLIDMENFLRTKLEILREERDRRLEIYNRLRVEDAEICSSMDIVEYSIAPNEIPTDEQLKELKQHVEQNRRLRDTRRARMVDLKTTIVRIMAKLNMTPKSEIEKEIASESIDALSLSKDYLHRVESLLTRLQYEYEKYLESIRQRVGEVKDELFSWWNRCHVDEAHRNRFQHIDEEDFDENALARYNEEIAHWQTYYQERQEVLEKIQLWQTLWKEKLNYEERDKDANRFLNRGGALLQEEKERKKVEKKLPIIRSEIKELAQQWNKGHPSQPILLEGVPVVQRLDAIESEHLEKKELEKQEKMKAKKQQLEAERLYGASPVTPNKKRNLATMRRGGNTPSQIKDTFVAGNSRYVHSSLAVTARSPIVAGSTCVAAKVSKLPPGLPKPTNKNSLKRRAEDRLAAPLCPINRHDASIATTASSGSYGEFVQEIREKGLEGQSSFIVIPTPTPTKMLKK